MRAKPVAVGGIDLYPPGAILGKAIDPLRGEAGVIRVLLMLR